MFDCSRWRAADTFFLPTAGAVAPLPFPEAAMFPSLRASRPALTFVFPALIAGLMLVGMGPVANRAAAQPAATAEPAAGAPQVPPLP